MDISGKQYGLLQAIRFTGHHKSWSQLWACLCRCGRTLIVRKGALESGKVKCCGCTSKLYLYGKRFSKLVALRPTSRRESGSIVWEVKCDCGKHTYRTAGQLRSGRAKSCGCLNRVPRHRIEGRKYGRLTVMVSTSQKDSQGSYLWAAQCDCGNTTVSTAGDMISGRKVSCGCQRLASAMCRGFSALTSNDIPIELVKAQRLLSRIEKEIAIAS